MGCCSSCTGVDESPDRMRMANPTNSMSRGRGNNETPVPNVATTENVEQHYFNDEVQETIQIDVVKDDGVEPAPTSQYDFHVSFHHNKSFLDVFDSNQSVNENIAAALSEVYTRKRDQEEVLDLIQRFIHRGGNIFIYNEADQIAAQTAASCHKASSGQIQPNDRNLSISSNTHQATDKSDFCSEVEDNKNSEDHSVGIEEMKDHINSETSDAKVYQQPGNYENLPVVLLRRGDIVFPVCHAGQNRSQVLWSLLTDINIANQSCYSDQKLDDLNNKASHTKSMESTIDRPMRVVSPHGAEGGYDPHERFNNVTEENYWEYCHVVLQHDQKGSVDERKNVSFMSALGRKKCGRFGHRRGENLQLMPSDHMWDFGKISKDRLAMHQFFNERYYARDATGQDCEETMSENMSYGKPSRRLYFCFMRAIEIVLRRILEANPVRYMAGNACESYEVGASKEPTTLSDEKVQDLSQIYIVGFTWGDPMSSRLPVGASVEEEDAVAANVYASMYQTYGSVVRFMDEKMVDKKAIS